MDTRTKHTDTQRLRDRIEEVLRENIIWGPMASPDRIIDRLVSAVGDVHNRRLLVFTCSTHGEVAREEVYCHHDAEEVMRRVVNAHGAAYGANCKTATMHVERIEA